MFQTDEEGRILHKNFNCNDIPQCLSHGHRNVTTIYNSPCFRNQVAIHLISDLSANPEAKYLTCGCQQRFFPTPGAFLAYIPLRDFSAYTADTGLISAIAKRFKPLTSLITQHFHQPLSAHQDSILHITSYTLVFRIPKSTSD